MILIDSNVPMYLVGTDHPHKTDAQRLLERLALDNRRLVSDAEVLQEILVCAPCTPSAPMQTSPRVSSASPTSRVQQQSVAGGRRGPSPGGSNDGLRPSHPG